VTKADRAEYDALLDALPHYERLAIEQCVNYKLLSKRDALAQMRERNAK